VASDDHNVYAINPNGSQKWKFATGGAVFSSPTIGSDGTIYVGSNDGNVYAIK
jgi:outer membrane protein assembly factor BamB